MINVDIDKILKGSIDMHVHHGPTANGAMDADLIAAQADQLGIRGIVFKDTGYMNAPLATLVNKGLQNCTVYGSICLNSCCGILNYQAVETAGSLGAKVVWMPTSSAENSIKQYRKMGIPIKGEGITLVDQNGHLDDRMLNILEIIKKYDMVLATGHISPVECFAVIEEAKNMGIDKMIITHPFGSEVVMDQVLTLEETKQLVSMGAYAEHTFVFHLPTEFSADPAITADYMRKLGPEHCIISTDLGLFKHNPTPAEGLRMFIATLACQGLSEADITLMVKTNPAKLLGIDELV